jgi:hypothetical protein
MDKLRVTLIGVLVGLIALIFVSITVLIAIGRDTQQVTTFALIVIPIVITAAGLGSLQVTQAQKLDNVAKNVNGNTTRLLDELERLRANEAARLAAEGAPVPADNVDTSGIDPMTEDTLLRIKSQRDTLPKHGD